MSRVNSPMGVPSEDIRRALKAEPFRPFLIHLADGRAFAVQHPELVLLTPSGRTIVVAAADGGVDILDCLLVTSLSVPDVRAG
jgi:hypothetical protein